MPKKTSIIIMSASLFILIVLTAINILYIPSTAQEYSLSSLTNQELDAILTGVPDPATDIFLKKYKLYSATHILKQNPNLSDEQKTTLAELKSDTAKEAILLGKSYMVNERRIERSLQGINASRLFTSVNNSASAYGALRSLWIQHYMDATGLLTNQQIQMLQS